MDEAKKRALLAFGIIVVGYIIYKLIGYFIMRRANVTERQYSKTFDLCRVLTKCSDHSYNDEDINNPSYKTGKEASKKNCALTKTNLSWRNNFQCEYNDIDENSMCFDCLDHSIVNENGEETFRCGDRKHDLDTYGRADYAKCLSIMGTTENLDKEEILFEYGLEITDLNDDNRYYKGLTNDWWKKHHHLYECLTGKDEYLYAPNQSNGEPGGWDSDKYEGYASSNFYRTIACNACFNEHGDDKDAYKRCMDEQGTCYQNYWSGTNCDFTDQLRSSLGV
jgi:hypothetical protein